MKDTLLLIQITCGLLSIGLAVYGYILACRAEKRAVEARREARLAVERSQELKNRLHDAYDECNGDRDD